LTLSSSVLSPRHGHQRSGVFQISHHHHELSLNRGDIIRVRREVDVNWLEGERNGENLFFYYTKVIYPFTPRRNTELGLKMDEVVTIRREIDENWYEGTNHLGEIGIFPRNHILTNSPVRPKTPKVFERDEHFSRPNRYRALYKFTPTKSDEVSLEVNDIIFVVEKCDDGWYIGTVLRTGQFGTFPGNYVERH
uniref:Sorbin and SH3 domain containing 1 n=1 Tax=Angiostrongylus cantonensis TaxID=6313 RepID=A0A0K0DG86_ANGCA